MSNRGFLALLVVVVALIVGSSSFYIVTEYERAVVLRFGRLVNADVPPGLHFKIPFADKVRKFDGRLLTADMRPESFFTVENKRLIVDSYIKWWQYFGWGGLYHEGFLGYRCGFRQFTKLHLQRLPQ